MKGILVQKESAKRIISMFCWPSKIWSQFQMMRIRILQFGMSNDVVNFENFLNSWIQGLILRNTTEIFLDADLWKSAAK